MNKAPAENRGIVRKGRNEGIEKRIGDFKVEKIKDSTLERYTALGDAPMPTKEEPNRVCGFPMLALRRTAFAVKFSQYLKERGVALAFVGGDPQDATSLLCRTTVSFPLEVLVQNAELTHNPRWLKEPEVLDFNSEYILPKSDQGIPESMLPKMIDELTSEIGFAKDMALHAFVLMDRFISYSGRRLARARFQFGYFDRNLMITNLPTMDSMVILPDTAHVDEWQARRCVDEEADIIRLLPAFKGQPRYAA